MAHTANDPRTPQLARPAVVASALVTMACLLLPGGSVRDRYRREFDAELHGMPRGRQMAHALQIVASSWMLRSATTDPERKGISMIMRVRSKPLLCTLNVHHRWRLESTPDGHRYYRCRRCGKDRMHYSWHDDDGMGPLVAGG